MITLSCLISMLQSLVTIGKIPLDWPSSLFWTFKTIEAVASLEVRPGAHVDKPRGTNEV